MTDKVYYVSEEGLQELKDELLHRSTVKRREIAEKIGTAKDQGDLSENFEYQDAKERQAANETRVIKLRDMISRASIIKKTSGGNKIVLGSKFITQLADGTEREFELVGATEANPVTGRISNESPLGEAFLGKNIGADVEIEVPSGKVIYTIKKIL